MDALPTPHMNAINLNKIDAMDDELDLCIDNTINININTNINGKYCGGHEKLRRCREEKEAAREAFKKRRVLATKKKSPKGACTNTNHGVKSDTLRKNSNSAAAQRYARDVYSAALTREISRAESERQQLARAAIAARSRRDELALRVQQLKDFYRGLGMNPININNNINNEQDLAQQQQQMQMEEEERADDERFDTEKALAAEGCTVSPRAFAESLLKYPTTCAL